MKKSTLSFRTLILSLVAWGLIGCTTVPVSTLPTPEEGKASIAGYVVNRNGDPVKNTPVRLAEVYRESEASEKGAFLLDLAFSPGGTTDEKGFFIISNIEPKEYVIVVGNVENNHYVIVADSNGRPKVWKLVKNQLLEVGTLRVEAY